MARPAGQAATQPDPNAHTTTCVFQVTLPTGLTVSPQKDATIPVNGQIKRVVALPEGQQNPQEIRVYLENAQP